MAEARYRIGTVARLAGLTTHVIRIWERRYAVLKPARSNAGARLYTDADVERLRSLKRVIDRGYNIGRVAALSPEDLAMLELEPVPADGE